MSTAVSVPQLGESVVEATVGRWLVKEGDQVTKDQPLVEILTDKTDTEINAPVDGVVVKVARAEDEVVAVGDTLCEIEEGASASTSAKPAKKKASRNGKTTAGTGEEGTAAASPAVRKAAREHSVDLTTVEGTGGRGRILVEDVRRAARRSEGAGDGDETEVEAGSEDTYEAPETRHGTIPPPSRLPQFVPSQALNKSTFKLPPYYPSPLDELVPFSRRRRIIADHMVFSKHTAPDVVTFAECDLHKTGLLREAHKDRFKKEGSSLTYLAFAVSATVRALREFPELNARVLEDAYVKLGEVNIGIAVDTDEGLVVPVIRHADELTIKGLTRAIDDVAKRARDGKLAPDDLAGKTFTISNPGRRGNLVGGAIISQPNVGILRMGTIKKRVVVMEEEHGDFIAIHPVMYMALTYDHRVVDGVHANGFLYRIVEILESADFDL